MYAKDKLDNFACYLIQNTKFDKYRVSHIEEYKVNQLWGVEESIILLIYGA